MYYLYNILGENIIVKDLRPHPEADIFGYGMIHANYDTNIELRVNSKFCIELPTPHQILKEIL